MTSRTASKRAPRATKLFRNRIALVFDFDETLAPSTYSTLLSELGFDADAFKAERVQPLVDGGWDEILARYYCLIEASKQCDQPLTLAQMEVLGARFPLYDHVEDMFATVEGWAREVVPDIEVEFYMLTAGMAEIPEATPIAGYFNQIWAGALHFNDAGEIVFVKRIITHPEKTRYLTQLAKGFHLRGNVQPANVHRDIDQPDYHIPYDQMIYVGDGASDMPAFAFMKQQGGMAIGVVNAASVEEWQGYSEMHPQRQVQNLAIADYSADSELMQSLHHAVRSVTEKVALRQMSQGK